ncbi:MAG: glycosyltransferase [Cyclobacteriaceae bacterium]|nr:glycosyltransferase [Cyclobacteriaceae bacterium]
MWWFMVMVFGAYYMLLVFLCLGWWRSVKLRAASGHQVSQPFISVIIPVRNEADTIAHLLDSLAQQDFGCKNFEVVVVNDHSVDKTEGVVNAWTKENPEISLALLNQDAEHHGKKAALTGGIGHAKGEIMVTTDGDCVVQPGWLSSIAAAFDDDAQLVVGAVGLQEDRSLFSTLQVMEFASLVGTGAATLGWGIPTMCNGANLAFRKSVFEEVNGYQGSEHIASGDDEFFLRKVASRHPRGIRFNNQSVGVVETHASKSITDFFSQRIRWAGKWKAHGAGFSAALAFFIFVFHNSTILLPVLAGLGILSWTVALSLLAAKVLLEAVFLFPVVRFCTGKIYPLTFLMLQFIYPFYVVCFGLAANFLSAEWKGRKI